MRLLLGFRMLIAICVALAILLGIVAFEQYRWSRRVVVADIQREREHLNASAALFATRFNRNIADAATFLQDDAQSAMQASRPVPIPPKIVERLYLVDEAGGQMRVEHLDATGRFHAVATPEWAKTGVCMNSISEQPLAILSPLPDGVTGSDRCFYALLDERYIREELIPQLLRETFGESSVKDYDFAIVSRKDEAEPIYGPKILPDLRRTFLTMPPQMPILRLMLHEDARAPGTRTPGQERSRVRMGARGVPHVLPLQAEELWELEIAHRSEPLADALRHERQRELLLGLAAELLFGAAVVMLLIGAHRMQRAAEERMRFVAAVSHELRTPISSISMLSRNQADGLVSGADKVSQYGELIHQQSRRLSDMIEQVLQYAGIHSNLGANVRARVTLKAVISDALADQKEELDRGQFQVEVNVPDGLPAAQGDAHLLRIAVSNLISNAIKYAKKGRWVGIDAEYSKEEQAVLVHVLDHGPGIDRSDADHLFEPFYRGRTAAESGIPGSGIGLSLVRSAVAAHGGSVTMTSTTQEGSVFTLRLPV